MNVFIREAIPADAELIADVSRYTFKETFEQDNTKENMDKFLNEQFTKGKLMLEVGAKENTFFLAYKGNELAGYAKVREGKAPKELAGQRTMEIARIYVLKQFLGTGIGNLLMESCLKTTIENKKKVAWLGVWEKNLRAIGFYQRWGFEKFADTVFLLGDDLQNDWLMKKTLQF